MLNVSRCAPEDNKDEKTELRFRDWMDKHCEHLTGSCPTCKKPCLLDKKFHDNIKNLYASIDSLGRLPRRREGGHGLTIAYVVQHLH